MNTLEKDPLVKEPGTLTDLEDLIRPPTKWRIILSSAVFVLWAAYVGYFLLGPTKVGGVVTASVVLIALYLSHRSGERQRWFLALVAMKAMSREIKELRGRLQ